MKTNPNVIDGVGKQFKDRREAGKILARELHAFANRSDAIVLALPRGGVPVGYEIAVALNLPLDSFEVRKLGVPGHEELAMGAIGSGGVRELSDEIISYLDIPPGEVVAAIEREGRELERRERLYRDQRPRPVIARR